MHALLSAERAFYYSFEQTFMVAIIRINVRIFIIAMAISMPPINPASLQLLKLMSAMTKASIHKKTVIDQSFDQRCSKTGDTGLTKSP